jgi:cellulose synthase/poly-beta-1,6-N-acetylglucosamine synthase-like glycosyltransferase
MTSIAFRLATDWISAAAGAVLAAPALYLALPVLSDAASLVASAGRRRSRPPTGSGEMPSLLFLVPAHDESLLIGRCVASLLQQDYPAERLAVVVVADNCSDDTAQIARRAGATVLERQTTDRRGKGHALGWALEQVDLAAADAIVIVDADTLLRPDFSRQLATVPELRRVAVQCYDGLSNEFENWLTTLSGFISRNRYEIALPLKQRAGLNVPLTGDGTVLGVDLLRRNGWNAESVTEGWELYARLTLAGERVLLARHAYLYAQEAHTLEQGRAQRTRWTSGRQDVLRTCWRGIVGHPRLSLHQKVDLVAELSSQGPVLQAVFGMCGLVLATLLTSGPVRVGLVMLFGAPMAQQALYTSLSLVRHPRRAQALRAFGRLPFYVAWRSVLGFRVLFRRPAAVWAKTARHVERPETEA